MLKRLLTKLPSIKEQYGFYFLTVLLLIITVTTIKPNLTLAGWDNFSTSLNPAISLERTFYATWREYRGMGVPSDSEAVDIFRQLFFYVLSPVLGKSIMEQLFVFLCLFTGVYSLYFLSRNLLKEYTPWQKELGATVASLLYLFNLNTLATFYHPMTMFVTRFGLFPLLLLIYFSILEDEKIRIKKLLIMVGVLLLGGSAYLTSTVFITLLIILGGILVFYGKRKTQLILISVILLTNMFWLLPFYNYTTQKSSILPLASTFLEVNEIQLNKGPQTFSWSSILTLQPDFITARPISLSDNSKTELHPSISSFRSDILYEFTLAVFPGLFITGISIVLIKREKRLLWIAIPLVFFLLLSRKFMPPTGFIYSYLTAKLPIFDIVFRFTDTKFYPVVALLGSILAGYTFVFVTSQINKRVLSYVMLAPLVILHLFIFKAYFTGYFINPLVFSKIPDAYYQLADQINKDPAYERVLHLPIEKISYWKPYVWGYEGSSFLTFLLDKALIERTFEPASIENDQINQAIFSITNNAQLLDESTLKERADMFSDLLTKANVGTFIWDNTINPKIYSRGKKYWGTFYSEGMYKVVSQMVAQKQLIPSNTYQVNLLSFLGIYKDYIVLPSKILDTIKQKPDYDIELYKAASVPAPFKSVVTATNIHTNHENMLVTPFLGNFANYTQFPAKPSVISPFYAPNLKMNIKSQNKYELFIPYQKISSFEAVQAGGIDSTNKENIINIYTKLVNDRVLLGFSKYTPFENGNDLLKEINIPYEWTTREGAQPKYMFASDWWVLDADEYSPARMSIDDVIIPLPTKYSAEYTYLGSVFVKTENLKITFLRDSQATSINPRKYAFTNNPNCYEDLYNSVEYEAEMIKDNGTLQLVASEGTGCITALLNEAVASGAQSIELELNYSITATEKKDANTAFHQYTNQFQKSIRTNVEELETYKYFDICLLNNGTGGCLNNHRTVKAQSNGKLIIPQTNSVGLDNPQVVFSLVTVGKQSINLNLRDLKVHSFVPISVDTLDLANANVTAKKLEPIIIDQGIIVDIPKPISSDSYYFNGQNDAFFVYNQPCQTLGGYRTTKTMGDSVLIYAENCDQGVSTSKRFDKEGFYTWAVQYRLLSGKNPKFTLTEGDANLKDEYLSLHTGYPNIKGSKMLQNYTPFEIPLIHNNFSKQVGNIIENTPVTTAYTYLYPDNLPGSFEQKLSSITQNSENQGIITVDGMHISRFPSSWLGMVVSNGESSEVFDEMKVISYKKIIPSLWKVEVQGNPQAINNYLLDFSQGYDRQWNLFQGSFVETLVGVNKVNATHTKVNGLDNGWEINKANLSDGKVHTYYVYYGPEVLAFVGWVLTTLTVTLLVLEGFQRRKS